MIWTDAAPWLAPRPVARATLVLGALPAAVWWPAPWKLLIKTTIDEMPPPGAQTTQLGEFTSHIHPTSGTARLATSPDGSRILRLDNLHATLGPQLRVWLSDTRVAMSTPPESAASFCGAPASVCPLAPRSCDSCRNHWTHP
ncbi:DM13 domain-containing protein [Mycobacterium paraintracellulare]